MPIRVVLAEENLLIREGVLRLLDAEVRIELAAACGDPDALLAVGGRMSVMTTPVLESGSASRAYMLKERVWQSHQLIAAICEVAHGGSVMDQKVVESLLVLKRRGAHSPLVNLTQREREVLAQEPHADRRVRAVLVFLAHQA